MSDVKPYSLPELLAPAGSPEALRAAVAGGADAVYLGMSGFNARAGAVNFDTSALEDGIRTAHAYGVKVYITLNTLVYDRELSEYLRTAETAYRLGADALIVADTGGAMLLRTAFPDFPLHASTQMSAHNAAAGAVLRDMGFCRMVVARETNFEDLKTVCRTSPVEVELFVHGALCMSASGQCLFSSVVGGRSGNRGECAQPCRLPYNGKNNYPLSPKDLSLAQHVPELLSLGASSFKIEGRMKSPDYVYGVVKIWRRLLDERRNATDAEMKHLSALFSRGGFTDGYFTGKIDRSMLGVRSAEDKEESRTVDAFAGIGRKLALDLHLELKQGTPARLSVTDERGNTASVTGPVPTEASEHPTAESDLREKLTRLGATPYVARKVEVDTDEGLVFPFSFVNAMRRDAVEALQKASAPDREVRELDAERTVREIFVPQTGVATPRTVAVMQSPAQVTPDARAYFERIYLPLYTVDAYPQGGFPADGVQLEPVIPDSELPVLRAHLATASRIGVKYALVGNLGHLAEVLRAGLVPVGDFRLNVTNRASAARLCGLGFTELILSPELTLPRQRDLFKTGLPLCSVVYGRIPLMVLSKCVGREIGGCDRCAEGQLTLVDRLGVNFPVRRISPDGHRNVIYNSVPTYMADRETDLAAAGIRSRCFLFTVETAKEVDGVIHAHRTHAPSPAPVRRMMK